MNGPQTYDAVVVGSGPNGLAAAIELAHSGRRVAVLEGRSTIGGGMRSAEITLPGFVHDLGSAIYPLGYASPFFRSLPLREHGLEWIHPSAPLAHPFDDGTAVVLERSIAATAAGLGPDAAAYGRLMEPICADAGRIADFFIGRPSLLRHPLALATSGMWSLRDARALAESEFDGERARGLFAGNAAHSFLPLDRPPSAMFGLLLGTLGHAFGWPFPKGGSQALADALASYLASLGGEIYTDAAVRSVEDVPRTRAVLFDVTPRQLLDIAGQHFTEDYNKALKRYRYCPGPNGSTFDMTGRIEAQIERFAPGFRDLVLAKSVAGTADLERWNPNLVGGDINGGYMDLRQLFTRPMPRINPYSTPAGGLYICSSSTPPGGGVHGMCGYLAARAALRYLQ